MTATYNPGVHRFAVFVVCWTLLLFVAGALVTSNDAALSVPDWPLSYGSLHSADGRRHFTNTRIA